MAFANNFRINAFACSNVGQVRSTNEDSFVIANLTEGVRIERDGDLKFSSGPNGSFFAVADGMGGAAAGQMASRIGLGEVYRKVQGFIREIRQPEDGEIEEILVDAVAAANRKVYKLGSDNEDYEGMGTTLTAALELHGRIVIAQIGDSRAYLLREGRIRQLTKDQSLVAQRVLAGEITEEDARRHPERNVLLQALGVRPKVEIVLQSATLRPDDVLLLCSDGLHGQMSAEEIYETLAKSPSPYDACLNLVDLANHRGGPDNITVLLIQFSL
jgi:PPM family protein phosphatase